MVKKLLIPMLIFCLRVEAESVGVSYYAIQKFSRTQCADALKVFRGVQNPKLAILWSTFGNNKSCIRRYLNKYKDKYHVLQIHYSNETCRRINRICDDNEIDKKLRVNSFNKRLEKEDKKTKNKILKRIEEIDSFLDKNKNDKTFIILSTGLEDNYNDLSYERLINLFYERLPTKYLFARNPAGENTKSFNFNGAFFAELHSIKSRFNNFRCIFNNDGTDVSLSKQRRALKNSISIPELSSALRKFKNCKHRFVWWNNQGIVDGKFIFPRDRTIKLFNSDILAINKIIKEIEK